MEEFTAVVTLKLWQRITTLTRHGYQAYSNDDAVLVVFLARRMLGK